MSWSKWKIGLLVAALSALCDGVIVVLVDPNIALKALAIALAVMMAKAAGLYLKQHPVEEIVTETELIRRASIEVGKKVGLVLVCAGVLFLGSGCMGTGGLAKLARELARDPATLSLRMRVGTPYGTGEFDFARSGVVTNVATAGGGTVSVGTGGGGGFGGKKD